MCITHISENLFGRGGWFLERGLGFVFKVNEFVPFSLCESWCRFTNLNFLLKSRSYEQEEKEQKKGFLIFIYF